MNLGTATLHRPPPWHPPADPSVAPPTQRYMPLRRTRATTCGSHTPALGDLHAHPGVLVPRELGAPAGHFSEISDLNSDFEDRNAFGAIIRANWGCCCRTLSCSIAATIYGHFIPRYYSSTGTLVDGTGGSYDTMARGLRPPAGKRERGRVPLAREPCAGIYGRNENTAERSRPNNTRSGCCASQQPPAAYPWR
jgi:hypothetical protein